MKIIGVDPGIKGGLACYDDGVLVSAIPTPVVSVPQAGKKKNRNEYDTKAIVEWIKHHEPTDAVIELVHSMPSQGVSSTFFFGKGFGILIGIISGLEIPLTYTRPQEWKRYHDLIGSGKDSSLELARDLWPEHTQECFRLKKHDGIAEAALIAKFRYDNPVADDQAN